MGDRQDFRLSNKLNFEISKCNKLNIRPLKGIIFFFLNKHHFFLETIAGGQEIGAALDRFHKAAQWAKRWA